MRFKIGEVVEFRRESGGKPIGDRWWLGKIKMTFEGGGLQIESEGRWLETISKNLKIELRVDLPEAEKNEDTTFKQVRAIELILRSLIHEQIGTNEELIAILGNIFKNEIN